MKFLVKLLCLAIVAGAMVLLLRRLSDGFTNWEVATWFANLSI